MLVTRGWREGEKGNCCLLGIEFQFYKMKKFWRSVAQQCTYTIAPYTYTCKNGKYILCVFYNLNK